MIFRDIRLKPGQQVWLFLLKTVNKLYIQYKRYFFALFLFQKPKGTKAMKNYFENCENMDQAKKLFRDLAMANHPDRGGDTETMKEINRQWESFCRNPKFGRTDDEADEAILYAEILEKLVILNGITIELVGSWIWVSGNTYPVRGQIKDAGLFFSNPKKMWYYRPAEHKSRNFRSMEIEQIRAKYGSKEIATRPQPKFELN